jgi:hypothetical protein
MVTVMKMPTRPLLGSKPLHYVNSINTDIRRTFRRFRLLAYFRDQQLTGLRRVPSSDASALAA